MTASELYFCTYFDHRYLVRGLAMIRSLAAYCPAARVWVLCMDDTTYATLTRLALPGIRMIRLSAVEQANPDLRMVKPQRTLLEYYFTCTPALPRFVFDNHPEVEQITYLDADLFFFADPTPLFGEIGTGSIGLVRQNMVANTLEMIEKYGVYNVSWVTFRHDATALACLRWWQDRCIEWCFLRAEDGKFGEQKYLDDWPSRFANVVVLEHKGANLARWSIARYHLTEHAGRQVYVDDLPLIFYHFSGLTQVKRWLYNPKFGDEVKVTTLIRRRVYGRYLRAISIAHRQIDAATTGAPLDNKAWHEMRHWQSGTAPRAALQRRLRALGSAIARGRLLVNVGGVVL